MTKKKSFGFVKKALSCILSAAMVVAFAPAVALADAGSEPSITVYKQADGYEPYTGWQDSPWQEAGDPLYDSQGGTSRKGFPAWSLCDPLSVGVTDYSGGSLITGTEVKVVEDTAAEAGRVDPLKATYEAPTYYKNIILTPYDVSDKDASTSFKFNSVAPGGAGLTGDKVQALAGTGFVVAESADPSTWDPDAANSTVVWSSQPSDLACSQVRDNWWQYINVKVPNSVLESGKTYYLGIKNGTASGWGRIYANIAFQFSTDDEASQWSGDLSCAAYGREQGCGGIKLGIQLPSPTAVKTDLTKASFVYKNEITEPIDFAEDGTINLQFHADGSGTNWTSITSWQTAGACGGNIALYSADPAQGDAFSVDALEPVASLALGNMTCSLVNPERDWPSRDGVNVAFSGLEAGTTYYMVFTEKWQPNNATNPIGKPVVFKFTTAPTLVEQIVVTAADDATSISEVRGTLQLSATVLPDNATSAAVEWSIVEGDDKATVDANGKVTAKEGAADGNVVVRATATDGSGVYGEITIAVSNQVKLYVGNMAMSSRSQSGVGSGTANDPYVFAVKATQGTDKSINPYTQPSQFWGESQSVAAAIAKFAVEFREYYEGTSGKVASSMAFDTITKKADGWVDFTYAFRVAPVSARDTSTGDLRIGFAFKGDFSTYFTDWTYRLDVAGLTAEFAADKQAKPGDVVTLTHYGSYDQAQTSRGTDYSINLDNTEGALDYSVEAVVGEDGYAEFSGKQTILHGGNYVLSVTKKTDPVVPVTPSDPTTPVQPANPDQDAADAVIAKIGAIGTVTADSKAAIEAARAAYDALSAEQRALVSADQLKALTDAEAAYAEIVAPEPEPEPEPAVTTRVVKGVTYTVSGSTVKATKIAKAVKSATILDTVKIGGKTYKVTAIPAKAYKGCTKLTKLTVGANIKTIGASAFSGCTKLKTITIKSKNLTKKSIKNSMKGSSVVTVKVKVSTKKATNQKYAKVYAKIFTKANCGKKVTAVKA